MLVTPGFAASVISKESLQQTANQYLKNHHIDEHISAISITVQAKNSPALSVYAGNTSYHNQTPITENNLFHIGSITKSFISALILQLESDTSLNFSINDSVSKFFPQYSKWQNISIKQLLNMTSGITDYMLDQNFIDDLISDPYRHRRPTELIHYSWHSSLRFKPGTQYDYSNANYILLGMIIEKVTGHTLAYELRTRFFEPLKLNHTFYISGSMDEETHSSLVRSYMYKKITHDFIPMGTDTTDYSMSFYGASGGIISSTADMAIWIRNLFTPDKILSQKQLLKLKNIISTKNGKRIEAPSAQDPDGFGLGIICSYFPEINELAYAYEGITFAGRAGYLYHTSQDIIVSVAVNSSVDGKEDNQDHLKELMLYILGSSLDI